MTSFHVRRGSHYRVSKAIVIGYSIIWDRSNWRANQSYSIRNQLYFLRFISSNISISDIIWSISSIRNGYEYIRAMNMQKISVVRHTIPHNGTVSTHSPFFIIDNCRCALHEMIHPPSGQCCLIYFKAHDSDYNSSFFAQQYLVISL